MTAPLNVFQFNSRIAEINQKWAEQHQTHTRVARSLTCENIALLEYLKEIDPRNPILREYYYRGMEDISHGVYDRDDGSIQESISRAAERVKLFPMPAYKSRIDENKEVLDQKRAEKELLALKCSPRWILSSMIYKALLESDFNYSTPSAFLSLFRMLDEYNMSIVDAIESDCFPIVAAAKASAISHANTALIDNPAIERDIDLAIHGHGDAVARKRRELIRGDASLLDFDLPLMRVNIYATREQARRNRLIAETSDPQTKERAMLFTRSFPEFRKVLAEEACAGEIPPLFRKQGELQTYQERLYE